MFTFPVVSLEQSIIQSEILFEVLNIDQILRKTSIGEFVRSDTFELDFPTSIGKSKWNVILFLNGQYDHKGNPDKRVSLYLKIMYCEKPSMILKLNVGFQFDNTKSWKLDQKICFKDVNSRWIGPQFFFNLSGFKNPSLFLSIDIKVNSQLFGYKNSFCKTEPITMDYRMLDNDINEEREAANPLIRMKDLLMSWKLDKMYDKLVDSGFDYYSLQYIIEEDLVSIFNEKSFLGPLRMFRVKHSDWIKTLAASKSIKGPSASSSTSASSDIQTSISCESSQRNDLSVPAENVLMMAPKTNEDVSNEVASVLSVDAILRDTEEGRDLKKYYAKRNKLLPEQRKLLIQLIVNHLIVLKKKVASSKIAELSDEIPMLFPKEEKEDYQNQVINGKKTVGILQAAYNNRLAAIKSKKRKRAAWLEETEDEDDEANNEEDNLDDGVKASVDWMKEFDPNSDDENSLQLLIDHWKMSFPYRSRKVKSDATFADKMKEFPFLKKTYAFALVSYDFEKMYQNVNPLKSEWENFFKANMQTLKEIILDPETRASLNDVDVSNESNFTHLTLALALHALAIPSSKVTEKKRWKPSLLTSQLCFFECVTDLTKMQSTLRLHLANCDKKKMARYPIIFGIGPSNADVSEYVVAVDDALYTFTTIFDAMDAAFKCFIVFKIPFPPTVINFWALFNHLFYKIKYGQLKLSPSLSTLSKSFD